MYTPTSSLKKRLFQTTIFIAITTVMSVAMVSCKKDKAGDDGIKRITDVVPAQYVKVITDNGMPIYEGGTPPVVDGKFKLSPYRFDYDNHKEPGLYPQPGQIMSDLVIEFRHQEGQDIEVAFGGNYLNGIELKSPFITGSGNSFTVCFTATMFGGMGGLFQFPFAFLFSGKIEGNVIKDLKMGRVGLGDVNSEGFSVKGEIDLYSDADGTSEQTP